MAAYVQRPGAVLDSPNFSAQTCCTSSTSAGDTLSIYNSTGVWNPQWLCSRWVLSRVLENISDSATLQSFQRSLESPQSLGYYMPTSTIHRTAVDTHVFLDGSCTLWYCGETSPGIHHVNVFAQGGIGCISLPRGLRRWSQESAPKS